MTDKKPKTHREYLLSEYGEQVFSIVRGSMVGKKFGHKVSATGKEIIDKGIDVEHCAKVGWVSPIEPEAKPEKKARKPRNVKPVESQPQPEAPAVTEEPVKSFQLPPDEPDEKGSE